MDIKNTLKKLSGEIGVSGNECAASLAASQLLKAYAENVEIDPFGNVTGYVYSADKSAKTVMLDAHIDSIGLIVTYIEDSGFLRVGACGGVDMRVFCAQSVTIWGKNPLVGVVSSLPPHVSDDRAKVPDVTELSIDIGMTKEQAEEIISLGDRVTVNAPFGELCGDRVTAPFIDDRGGVCAVLSALDMLGGEKPSCNLAVCFSAQEETGERGARQSAFRLAPDEALVVDVSFGKTPDSAPYETAPLGSGVMIGYSAALDRGMSEKLRALASEREIPYTVEVMPTSTGTNADAVAVSGAGVKCCTLSFPIRYMHTPAETVDINDISAAARLIYEYIK